ncbi:hypothetical protein V5P93_005407 [Actinokineospora auranticolor]|uniref:PE family protein n=1 Tax=Actinokineospora auranticolor TaxID=155976 RepID=A0A2S6GQU3_9PSEU|nr:hypothetical protein [Actinokineospora auranticolor]PPK67566.1 hypothetical protein CLV40_107232 [Actinokineospora auranticolor]
MFASEPGGMVEGVAMLRSAATDGGFAVNETGGQALLTAIQNMLDWIDGQQYNFQLLSREPQLGSTNAAAIMKPFMVSVATDERGFVTQVMALRDSLEEAKAAIKDAMKNYHSADAAEAGHYPGQ